MAYYDIPIQIHQITLLLACGNFYFMQRIYLFIVKEEIMTGRNSQHCMVIILLNPTHTSTRVAFCATYRTDSQINQP